MDRYATVLGALIEEHASTGVWIQSNLSKLETMTAIQIRVSLLDFPEPTGSSGTHFRAEPRWRPVLLGRPTTDIGKFVDSFSSQKSFWHSSRDFLRSLCTTKYLFRHSLLPNG